MSQPRLDLGVSIERVRVLVGAGPHGSTPDRGSIRSPALPGDHRIVVGELIIEAQRPLPEAAARRLGAEVGRGVAERLVELQRGRLPAIVAGQSAGGMLRIGTTRVRLRGDAAAEPRVRRLVDAVVGAIERKVSSCRTT